MLSCKQAIFRVVNNQQLGGNQLGDSHPFLASLISLYLSSFVNFLSWGLRDPERKIYFLSLRFPGEREKGYFLHLPHLEFKYSTFKSASLFKAGKLEGIYVLCLATERQGLKGNDSHKANEIDIDAKKL